MKTLLQFKAPWCNPCRQISPLIQEFSSQFEIKLINVDEEPELAVQYKIKSIPAVIILDGEKEVARLIGKQITKESLTAHV